MYLGLNLNLSVFVRQTQHPPEKSERTIYRTVRRTFLHPSLRKLSRRVCCHSTHWQPRFLCLPFACRFVLEKFIQCLQAPNNLLPISRHLKALVTLLNVVLEESRS